MKILKQKDYNGIIAEIGALNEEIEELKKEKFNLQKILGMIHQHIQKWGNNKIGNLRAVVEIAKFFGIEK